MSPGSMSLPTHSSWEMGQGLSPYNPLPPPDMQSECLFLDGDVLTAISSPLVLSNNQWSDDERL